MAEDHKQVEDVELDTRSWAEGHMRWLSSPVRLVFMLLVQLFSVKGIVVKERVCRVHSKCRVGGEGGR
jgi:hypothetical protein